MGVPSWCSSIMAELTTIYTKRLELPAQWVLPHSHPRRPQEWARPFWICQAPALLQSLSWWIQVRKSPIKISYQLALRCSVLFGSILLLCTLDLDALGAKRRLQQMLNTDRCLGFHSLDRCLGFHSLLRQALLKIFQASHFLFKLKCKQTCPKVNSNFAHCKIQMFKSSICASRNSLTCKSYAIFLPSFRLCFLPFKVAWIQVNLSSVQQKLLMKSNLNRAWDSTTIVYW